MNKYNLIQELEQLTDEQIVARGRESARLYGAACNVLIGRHRQDLLRRCRARLGNQADAEEAAQETLLRVFRNLSGFRGDAAFRTWLFTIGDNQCSNVYQRRMRRIMSEHLQALMEIHEELGHEQPFELDADASEVVREVLSALPEQARDVLMLRFYRDLSLDDIAQTLGIGLSAAKMRLYRAMAQFEAGFQAAGETQPV